MKKISLKNVENTLSRKEMRTIMAGSGGGRCRSDLMCWFMGTGGYTGGGCYTMQTGQCRCVAFSGGSASESVPSTDCLA